MYADRRHGIGKIRPSASRSKRIDHEHEVMLTIEKSMVSMPTTALQRYVIIAYDLELDSDRKACKSGS